MIPHTSTQPCPESRTYQESTIRLVSRTISAHPEWVGWAAFVLALFFLFVSLGLADDSALGIWISGDTLYPVNVFTDVLGDGYSLSGWRFSIAPCWFPDLVAAGAFWLVTQNPILGTLFAGFIQIALIVAAFHVIGLAIGIRALHLQDTLLLGTGTAITLYVAAYPGAFYPKLYQFFLPQTHVGSMLPVLFGWGMAFLMVRHATESARPQVWLIVVYGFVCILAGMSNLLFVMHMLAPLAVGLGVLTFFGLVRVQQCWVPVVCGSIAAGIGIVLNRILFTVTDVSAQSELSQDRLFTSLDVFVRGFVAHVLIADLLHISAVAWAAVSIAYLAWFLRRVVINGRAHIQARQTLMALFFLVSLVSAVLSAGAIILGGSNGLAVFKDYVWSMHYLHQAFLFPLFGFPAIIAWTVEARANRRVLCSINWICATSALLVVLILLVPSQLPAQPIYAYRPPLVRFIDEIAQTKGLRYGYAGYWQARLITLLSHTGVRSYAVDGVMNPLLWANNEQWYRQSLEDRTKPPRIDFVVLDDPLWKLSREAVIQVLGEPVSEMRVQNTRVLIYGGR